MKMGCLRVGGLRSGGKKTWRGLCGDRDGEVNGELRTLHNMYIQWGDAGTESGDNKENNLKFSDCFSLPALCMLAKNWLRCQ